MEATTKNIKPGYKKTPAGVIPKDWKVKKLGELCELKSGGTPLRSKPEYWKGQIPWLTTSLIDFNVINSVEQYITKAGLENSSTKIFPQGTTVIAIYGQGVTRGKVARLGFDMATNQACVAFLNHDLSFQNFLFFSLESNYDRLRNLSNDGSQKNLSSKLLGNFKLPIPPLPEQEQIASCLTTWDKGMEKLSTLIAAKKQQKKGLMQGLFNGQLTVDTSTSLSTGNGQLIQAKEGEDFTEDWEEVMLGDIAKIYQPKTISQSNFTKAGYQVYGANGVIGYYSKFNHEKEQIAVVCRGSTCGLVNLTKPKSWITGNAMVINIDENNNIHKYFLYNYLDLDNLFYLITGSGQPK